MGDRSGLTVQVGPLTAEEWIGIYNWLANEGFDNEADSRFGPELPEPGTKFSDPEMSLEVGLELAKFVRDTYPQAVMRIEQESYYEYYGDLIFIYDGRAYQRTIDNTGQVTLNRAQVDYLIGLSENLTEFKRNLENVFPDHHEKAFMEYCAGVRKRTYVIPEPSELEH